MIKIIKEGRMPIHKEVWIGDCDECHTIFKFDYSDFRELIQEHGIIMYNLEISCPYCNRTLRNDWELKKIELPIEEYKEGIHIIKEGSIPIKDILWEVTCKNCNTEFTCESKDFNGYTEEKDVYNDNINCPLCKKLILRDDCLSRLITVGYKKKGE